MPYEKLFSPIKLGPLQLKNRIVYPATSSQFALENGYASDKNVAWYEQIAKGGVGMIVIEATAIHNRASGTLLRLSDDSYIEGFKRIVDGVHKHGIPCGVQLVHWLASNTKYHAEPTSLSRDEIDDIVRQFAAAAKRAFAAGVDFVQPHAAHAYTLASFLSPLNNQRTDEYGGNVKKRAKILIDVLEAIRKECGADAVVNFRINGDDFIAGGLTNQHARETAKILEAAGVPWIDVSAGANYSDGRWYVGYSGLRMVPTKDFPELCNLYLMEEIKKAVNIPVQGVGRIPMPDVAERVLQENRVDLVGICRPIISDPEWPIKAMEGREKKIRKCLYCANCVDTQRHFKPLSCPVWKNGRNGDSMFKFEPLPEDAKVEHLPITYDRVPYATFGHIYVPHVHQFPPREK